MKSSDFVEYGDAEFSWQVNGVRDGFENEKIVVDIDNEGNIKENEVTSQKRENYNNRVKHLGKNIKYSKK